jgi:hypothetical protein
MKTPYSSLQSSNPNEEATGSFLESATNPQIDAPIPLTISSSIGSNEPPLHRKGPSISSSAHEDLNISTLIDSLNSALKKLILSKVQESTISMELGPRK